MKIQNLNCIAYAIGWTNGLDQFIEEALLSNLSQTGWPNPVQVAGPIFEPKSQGRAYDFHQKLYFLVFFDKNNKLQHFLQKTHLGNRL